MSKWALVIGSQTGELKGVDSDARNMAAALGDRGFKVDLRIGQDATRKGILDGYRALIEHARSVGDRAAAVFYYAGHGSYVESIDRDAAGGTIAMQVLHPFDVAQWSDGDFRGVSAWELSLLQNDLTQITQNVTAILDCCHAGGTLRSELRVRGQPTLRKRLMQHRDDLFAKGARLDRLHPIGNPYAVRVVACGPQELACERARANGWGGVMTDALLAVLAEAKDSAVPWFEIGRAVRERVEANNLDQRPDIEGPTTRVPFTLEAVMVSRSAAGPGTGRPISLVQRNGTTRVRAGRITGAVVDNVYGLAPPLTSAWTEAISLGAARITRVSAFDSDVAVSYAPGKPNKLPSDAIAFPLQVTLPRLPVAVEVDGDVRSRVERAIAGAPRLRLATPGELPLVTIRRPGAGLVIADDVGPLAASTLHTGEDAITKLIAIASIRAASRFVLSLTGEGPPDLASVEWGIVENGAARRQPDTGGQLRSGQCVYVKVVNRTQRAIFAHVFNVGVSGRVLLLTRNASGGQWVSQDHPWVLGANSAGVLSGLRAKWPEGVPKTSPRTDHLVILITERAVDLRVLETDAEELRLTRDSPPDQDPECAQVVLCSYQLQAS